MHMYKNVAAALLGLAAAGSAMAQANACPASCGASGNIMSRSQIANLLGGKVVCAVLGNEVWQEFHAGTTTAGGQLSDLKGTATPQEVVGSWSTSPNSDVVVYDYGTGGTYAYTVCAQNQNAATVHFCGSALGGRNITNATVKASGPC